jgi:hypothetical protein
LEAQLNVTVDNGMKFMLNEVERIRVQTITARYTGSPMDLNNMRSFGVTKIGVYYGCGHQTTIDVLDLPGGLLVSDLRFQVSQEISLQVRGRPVPQAVKIGVQPSLCVTPLRILQPYEKARGMVRP